MDKKVLVLFLLAASSVCGIISLSFLKQPPVFTYIVVGLGQSMIILISVTIGFYRARTFTMKSAIGRSLALVSLGMLFWMLGNLAWMYYNVAAQIEVPYPSMADVFYLGMIPFATAGLFLLLRNLKTRFDAGTVLKIAIIPVAVFLLTYWLFVQSKLSEDVPTLTKILNVAYPSGDIIFMSFALVILTLIGGGRLFRPLAIICFGFILQAVADLAFSWTISAGTYYTGSPVDTIYVMAFFTVGLGMYYTSDAMKVEAKSRPRGT